MLSYTAIAKYTDIPASTINYWKDCGYIIESEEIVTYSLNETHLFVATITNNRIESWGNGASDRLFSFSQTLRTNLGNSPMAVGSSPLFARYNPVLIATVFIVPSDLSATRRQVLEGHFAWESGINSRFPTNHPFRNNRPITSDWV